MTDSERASAINMITDQLEKAKEEILEAVANAGASPESDSALTRLTGVSQALDDLNADKVPDPIPDPVPVEEPPVEETPPVTEA